MAEITRFDLEQQIQQCWNVVDDINVVFEGVCDRGMTEDEIANALLGLNTLYQLKFEKLFATFEGMIKNGTI